MDVELFKIQQIINQHIQIKAKFYTDLLPVAQAQLEKIKLPLESPVAVIGDASGSMEVAIRTATILSSLLTAICSAKLVFISFLSHQHANGQMYSQFKDANVPDVLQFKFNRERPDLTKIDNLIGLLSTGSSASFDNNLEPLQTEFQQNGIESVITRLVEKQDENAIPMETSVAN